MQSPRNNFKCDVASFHNPFSSRFSRDLFISDDYVCSEDKLYSGKLANLLSLCIYQCLIGALL